MSKVFKGIANWFRTLFKKKAVNKIKAPILKVTKPASVEPSKRSVVSL